MRNRGGWLVGAMASFALAAAAFAGCGSSDDGGAPAVDDAGGFASSDASEICDEFTHAGQPCSKVSALVCFRQCVSDGCQCVAAASGGGGMWKCTTDFSCEPDGSPLDDAAEPFDSASLDAAGDGDAADAGDAETDAPADAALDADAGDAADASDAADG